MQAAHQAPVDRRRPWRSKDTCARQQQPLPRPVQAGRWRGAACMARGAAQPPSQQAGDCDSLLTQQAQCGRHTLVEGCEEGLVAEAQRRCCRIQARQHLLIGRAQQERRQSHHAPNGGANAMCRPRATTAEQGQQGMRCTRALPRLVGLLFPSQLAASTLNTTNTLTSLNTAGASPYLPGWTPPPAPASMLANCNSCLHP